MGNVIDLAEARARRAAEQEAARRKAIDDEVWSNSSWPRTLAEIMDGAPPPYGAA